MDAILMAVWVQNVEGTMGYHVEGRLRYHVEGRLG